jgi:selenocysteine lyase/cysteine desulfurase
MLGCIEEYIRDVVCPLYANTHTEASATGNQTTQFREESREVIMAALNANKEEYACVFCGTGSTGAITKLIDCLEIRIPAGLNEKYNLLAGIPEEERPVVFIGPYEHHSNEVMWRETIATVVAIGEDSDGNANLDELEKALQQYSGRSTKIGSFCAGSNVTGICAEIEAVTNLLHKYGALSFWDFAGSGPYVKIDVKAASMDAVFLSPHKFIGGPGTCGLLVAKRSLFTNRVPSVPGGGTVTYVSPSSHEYDPHIEHREDGGTPAIIQAIRCGLVFQLKDMVGAETIESIEQQYSMKVIKSWLAHPNIELMGSDRGAYHKKRLSIISFNIRYSQHQSPSRIDSASLGKGAKVLHPHFVIALLNDLYGIQARSGCSCTGPYGHRLFGITEVESAKYKSAVSAGNESAKPGWARVNFNCEYHLPCIPMWVDVSVITMR